MKPNESESDPQNRLTWWDRVLRRFGVRVHWEWCITGCTIGRHSWSVVHEKCRNGTPVRSGYFLTIYKFPTEEAARAELPEFLSIAAMHNAEHGYAK